MTAGFVVEVAPDPDALAEAAARSFVAAAEAAIRARGTFIVALSGGGTPRPTYERLAQERFSSRVAWSQVQVVWGDERCVPPDHPDSNYRMAREALLDRVAIPPANVHRIQGEDHPTAAAERYEGMLRGLLSGPGARIDLLLLGLGLDGHTASLFPGGTALQERTRWVTAEYVPAVSGWRITLTLVVIHAAAEVLFLVSGDRKAGVLRRVLEEGADSPSLPARAVATGQGGGVRWLVDAAAAAGLARRG